MLIFIVTLCCPFIFHRENSESEALMIYNPRYQYYSYNDLAARGSYGSYYDQETVSSSSPTKSAKKPSHKQENRSQAVIDLSLQPLGALKIDSLTHGQIEIHPDKIDDVLLSMASRSLSMIPNFYQYIPSIPFFNDDEPEITLPENQSSEKSSHPKKHVDRNSDQDDSAENSDENDHPDENKIDNKGTENDNDDNAAEEHDILPETETEILMTDNPVTEGYVDKFVKYYSYAKPIAKAASLFVPGLGQYRGFMLGLEMADLAYNVASIYKKEKSYLSMGLYLGKEALKRLGRRNEPFTESQVSGTIISETDLKKFLDDARKTPYPLLDDEKEQEIKAAVSNILYKYCHDQEQYQNETERTKFINLMITCVKFIAFHEIIPATSKISNT